MANLYVNSRLTIPEKQISMTMARSSGPGGQNVNKVNTKVTLRWALAQCKEFNAGWRQRFLARHGNRINRDGEFILHSEKYRDQVRNIADVRQKLVNMLMECQAAPKVRKPTKPSRASNRRRLDKKRQQSQKKEGRKGKWSGE